MIVALLLGRKGSIGFPGKNTFPIMGKPLAWYPMNIAIETAENQRNNIRGFIEFQGIREIKKDQLEKIGELLCP